MHGKSYVNRNFAGTIYTSQDKRFTLTYKDSAYGNDHYMVEVSSNVWDDIPTGVNPMLIGENGWNLVFHFQDSPDRQLLLSHIPGSWFDILCSAYLGTVDK